MTELISPNEYDQNLVNMTETLTTMNGNIWTGAKNKINSFNRKQDETIKNVLKKVFKTAMH